MKSLSEYDPQLNGRWSEQKAADWYEKNGWLVGCNYITSTAINQLEMFQADSFDPITIQTELLWARDLGFNSVRVFLHHLLWEQDAKGFLERLDVFLSIAHRNGIKTMFVLFDAVWDPFPKLGKQPDPAPGIHNSGWVQSPGAELLNDHHKYDQLKNYVQGIVGHFNNDVRILIWDLFNEPDNMNQSSYRDTDYALKKADLSLLLLKKTISWARAMNPIQPLTAAPWQDDWSTEEKLSPIDNYMFTHSDIITFHCYENKTGMETRIEGLKLFKRPILCTEYMARPNESTFENILPLLKKNNVGAYNWGFVAGKTQTHYPWDSWIKKYENEPEVWFHDIYKSNGEAHSQKEVEFIKQLCRKDAEEGYKRVA